MSDLQVGDVVAERTVHLTRDSLVRYAGASGDFNDIHYRDDVAERVGLPGVLAHGMLTMGLAASPVLEWLGDPARLLSYTSRFTKPVVVDAENGADVHTVATVGKLFDDGRARIDLTVTSADQKVLGKAQLETRG